MHLASIFLVTLASAAANAIELTLPGAGDTVHVDQPWPVCWSSVESDPQSFCLYLTNFQQFPSQTILLQEVETADRCASVPGHCYPELRTSNYRVWASRCGDAFTIYGESGEFTAVQESCQ